MITLGTESQVSRQLGDVSPFMWRDWDLYQEELEGMSRNLICEMERLSTDLFYYLSWTDWQCEKREREVLSCISKALKIEGSSRSIQALDENDVCLLIDWLIVVTAMKLHPVSNEIMTGDNDHEKWYEMRVKRLAFWFLDASLCLLFFLPFNFIAFLLMFLNERNSAHLSSSSRLSSSSKICLFLSLPDSFLPDCYTPCPLALEKRHPVFLLIHFLFHAARKEKRKEERSFFIASARDGRVPLFLPSKHQLQVDQSNKDADLSLLSSCHLMLQFVSQFGSLFSFFDLLSNRIWFQSFLSSVQPGNLWKVLLLHAWLGI